MLDTVLNFVNEQRAVIHLGLHVLVPLVVASCFASKTRWKFAFALMMGTMLVDVDHLLATPIYAPDRCSILFHPLHQLLPIGVYGLMAIWPLAKHCLKKPLTATDSIIGWVGLGLLIHMLLDASDCLWMKAVV